MRRLAAGEGGSNKVGLVLEGGGAKSAYAFGCLKAMKERGLAFDVVSGSSSGALNAILWATDQLDTGEKLWRGISIDKVFARRFPRFPPSVAAPWLLFASLWWAYMEGANRSWVVPFLALVTAILLGTSIGYTPDGGVVANLARIGLAVSLVLAFLQPLKNRERILPLIPIGAGMIAISGTVSLLVGEVGRSQLFGLALALLVLGSTLTAFLVSKGLVSLFNTNPLEATVAKVVGSSKMVIKCFVTVAEKKDVYDPDNIEWTSPDAFGWPNWQPSGKTLFVPEYVNIQDKPPSEAARIACASAALPFGLVQPIWANGSRLVDGGAADNLPLNPVIDEGCEIVFVVTLSPSGFQEPEHELPLSTEGLVQRWRRYDRLLRLPSKPPPGGGANCEFDTHNEPPTLVPFREPPVLNFRTIVIGPSVDLGSFASGTLNFSAAYVARLIEMGYKDAIGQIDAFTAEGVRRNF